MKTCHEHYRPYFSGLLPPRYRKRRLIDGGFSVNQVVLDDDQHTTLTVSPFSGDAHISPKIKRRSKTAYTRLHIAEVRFFFKQVIAGFQPGEADYAHHNTDVPTKF